MEYSRQFRQPAFRGFGDQAMRSHRVTPAPQPEPAPAAPSRAQGVQTSLFSADEIRNPQGPAAPTFNASQFRATRDALPGMSTRSMAGQRVTPSPQPAAHTPATGASNWVQPPLTMLGPTPASPQSPGAAGPKATQWPTPAPAPAPSPTPAPRSVTINRTAYNAAGTRFGPTPASTPAPASRPAPPPPGTPTSSLVPHLNTPAGTPSARAAVTSAARAGTVTAGTPAPARRTGNNVALAGLGVGLAARAFESVTKVSTDPARSGKPLFKTSGGWSKS
ncbi:hypothetical protein [Streptomyces sp. NPDC002922]|uniref:hypothetical protein n=1 Tax=Streptomyces sp. NPDC002922 TaxID=3154439 RepID=UPI00339FACE4